MDSNNKWRKRDIVLVILIFAILAVGGVLYLLSKSAANINGSLIGTTINSSTATQLYSIANNETLANQVGIGGDGSVPQKINATPLTLGNKPEVLYIGAEYCPYCAVTRWGFIMALMRFGNFTNLEYMASDPNDVYSSSPTFTFLNATYSSQYIAFVHIEQYNRTGKPLQTLNISENATFKHYDSGEGIPFIDFGNQSLQLGSAVSPTLIWKHDWAYVLSSIGNNKTSISQAEIGSANVFTAQICKMDNFEPATVCDQPYVQQILRAESA